MVGPTDPCLEWGPLEETEEKSMNRAISMIKLAGELFITSSRPGMVDNLHSPVPLICKASEAHPAFNGH